MNRSNRSGSAATRSRPVASRLTSNDGQKKPPAGVKKWGDPMTPRRTPSRWSVITADRSRGSNATPLSRGQLGQHVGRGDVDASLEQQGAQLEADLLADLEADPIGRRGQRECGKRCGRKVVRPEPLERCGRDVAAEIGDLLGHDGRLQRSAVDDLEGPGPHPEADVLASQLGPVLHEPPQPEMGEGAHDVGEDLDDRRRCLGRAIT